MARLPSAGLMSGLLAFNESSSLSGRVVADPSPGSLSGLLALTGVSVELVVLLKFARLLALARLLSVAGLAGPFSRMGAI